MSITYDNMGEFINYSDVRQFYFRQLSLPTCRRVDVRDYKFWSTIGGVTNENYIGGERGQRDYDDLLDEWTLAHAFVLNLDRVGITTKGSQFPDLENPFFSIKRPKFKEDGVKENGEPNYVPIGNDSYEVTRHLPRYRTCSRYGFGLPRFLKDNKDNGQFFNNGFAIANLQVIKYFYGKKHIGYGLAGGPTGNADPSGNTGGTFMSSGYLGSGFFSQIWTGGYTNHSTAYNTKFIPDPKNNTLPDIEVTDYNNPRGATFEGSLRIATPFGIVSLVLAIYIDNRNPNTIWSYNKPDSFSVETFVELNGVTFEMIINSANFTFYRIPDYKLN
jgi:hypothetical protein